MRLRLAVFSLFILSIVLLFFVKHGSCRAYTDTWLGLLPLHVRSYCFAFLFVVSPYFCAATRAVPVHILVNQEKNQGW